MENILYVISKGIYESLTIDDGDSTISYKTSDFKSDYVYSLTLDQLFNVYKENDWMAFGQHTVGCCAFVLKDGSEISLNQFTNDIINNIMFLKISNKLLEDNESEIFIACNEPNHYISKSMMTWQNQDSDKAYMPLNPEKPYNDDDDIYDADKMSHDIDGYRNCQNIKHEIETPLNQLPAIAYCDDLKIVMNDNTIYKGYLPSIGQLMILAKYQDLINHVMSRTGMKKIMWNNDNEWWSSSEFSGNHAITLFPEALILDKSKGDKHWVMPLFKKQ